MSEKYANKILENYHISSWHLPLKEQGVLPHGPFCEVLFPLASAGFVVFFVADFPHLGGNLPFQWDK